MLSNLNRALPKNRSSLFSLCAPFVLVSGLNFRSETLVRWLGSEEREIMSIHLELI